MRLLERNPSDGAGAARREPATLRYGELRERRPGQAPAAQRRWDLIRKRFSPEVRSRHRNVRPQAAQTRETSSQKDSRVPAPEHFGAPEWPRRSGETEIESSRPGRRQMPAGRVPPPVGPRPTPPLSPPDITATRKIRFDPQLHSD